MRNGSWRASWLAPRQRRSFTPAPSDAWIEGMTRSSFLVVICISPFSSCLPQLSYKAVNPALGGCNTVIAAVLAKCKALRVHDLDLGNAEEAEKLAHELGLRMV